MWSSASSSLCRKGSELDGISGGGLQEQFFRAGLCGKRARGSESVAQGSDM